MNGWKACYFLNFGMKEKEKQIPSFWMKTLRGGDEGLKVIQKYFDTKLDMELQALDLSSRLHSLDYQSTQRLKKKKTSTGFIRILVSHEIPSHLWGENKCFSRMSLEVPA